MADDEQFSLCWNNFNTNLSAGFHESLCRGDLVDVTLAAEGQLVKAHRLVLSVCSPYFRKMFTQMPANQHAFVFLKDVSHCALKDLIQFMYCGEVNVKQDALPAFISTAEALQIKGLTDGDPAPSQSPAKPSTPAPQPTPIVQQTMTSPRIGKQQRPSTSRSYKIETIEDSGDDKATQIVLQSTPQQSLPQTTLVQTTTAVVSQKRPAQRSITTPQTKRSKNTADPLEATEPTQITVQTVSESNKSTTSDTEFIDLPIELPTKSEPDYTEDAGEVETAEQETTYVEDDSYGDMKYDDSYFTENEEGNASVSGAGVAATSSAVVKQQAFSDNAYVDQADQSANEAQGYSSDSENGDNSEEMFKIVKIINKKIDKLHNKVDLLTGQKRTVFKYPATTITKAKIFPKEKPSVAQTVTRVPPAKIDIVSDPLFAMPKLPIDELHLLFEFDKKLSERHFLEQVAIRLSKFYTHELKKQVRLIMDNLISLKVLIFFSWTGKASLTDTNRSKCVFANLEGIINLIMFVINMGPVIHQEKDIEKCVREIVRRFSQVFKRKTKSNEISQSADNELVKPAFF